MKKIVDTEVHKFIGLPEICQLNEFSRIYKNFENNIKHIPLPITMVSALLHSAEEVFFNKINYSLKDIYKLSLKFC